MSEREWKPGDVAMVTGPAPFVDQGQDYSVTSTEVACSFTVDGLWKPLDRRDYGFQAHEARTARPLVVIDPEDREQAKRLMSLYWGHLRNGDRSTATEQDDAMQAALREFADPKPPKPDEPQGLGAVVEDERGHVHTRGRNHSQPFVGEDGIWRPWSDIDAVRILNDGWVQP